LQGRLAGPPTRFFVQYVLIWLIFSVAATGLQFVLEQLGLFHGMKMWSIDETLSFGILIVAGVYQFLPIKRAALDKCSTTANDASEPMPGLRFGAHCLMATAPLMLLLYVGGAMNLFWIIGLSAVVTIEKWRLRPTTFSSFVGVICFLMAGYI
jgi:predicted metal-binding membrane protein